MNNLWDVLSILSPIISGFVMYFIYSFNSRLTSLEDRIQSFVTDTEVRHILNDNLNPVREDIRDIRQKIDRLLEFYLNERNVK